jgi:enamine deaminase RidA (YjgF/YER057c/UK114 family)
VGGTPCQQKPDHVAGIVSRIGQQRQRSGPQTARDLHDDERGIEPDADHHGPIEPLTDTPVITGKLGRELNEAQGAVAARETGLYILGTLKGCIGSLDRVVRVVHAIGFINCAPGFNTPSLVLNGFSDLMVEVFGEIGRHTRSAIGVAELYRDIPVEIEALFEVRD